MASTVHNISGEITQELLAAGENVDVSSVSLCNTHASLSCTVNLFMEQKTTASVTGGTFHIFKNTLLPAGATITHNFKFDNSIFGLFVKLTKSASETPTVDVILDSNTVSTIASNFEQKAIELTPTITNNIYTGDANFVHDQGTTSAQWVIDHNLSKKCSVTVVDSSNQVVIGQVTYNSDNRVTIDFDSSFSGKAFFN